jgi:hypothetical protein
VHGRPAPKFNSIDALEGDVVAPMARPLASVNLVFRTQSIGRLTARWSAQKPVTRSYDL